MNQTSQKEAGQVFRETLSAGTDWAVDAPESTKGRYRGICSRRVCEYLYDYQILASAAALDPPVRTTTIFAKTVTCYTKTNIGLTSRRSLRDHSTATDQIRFEVLRIHLRV